MTAQQASKDQQETGQEATADQQGAAGLIQRSAGTRSQAGIHTAAISMPDQKSQYQQGQQNGRRRDCHPVIKKPNEHEDAESFTRRSQQEQR